jgi:diacylglycerol O-acyltransferase
MTGMVSLTDEDRAILELESETIAGHTCKVIVLGEGAPGADDLRHLSPRIESLWEKVQRSPRRFALNVSNVPGPPSPVSIRGARVRKLHSLAEIGEHHALRVSAISYADRICFGLCADPAIVDDLETLATGIEAEAADLVAAAGG